MPVRRAVPSHSCLHDWAGEVHRLVRTSGSCLQLGDALLQSPRHRREEAQQRRGQSDLEAGAGGQGRHRGGHDVPEPGGDVAHAVLVGAQPHLVVATGSGEFFGQDIGTDHREAGAAPTVGPGEYPASPTRASRPLDHLSITIWLMESK